VDRLKAAAPRSEIRDLDPVIDAMRVIKSPRENLSAFVPIEIDDSERLMREPGVSERHGTAPDGRPARR